jgi:hypothetical protein
VTQSTIELRLNALHLELLLLHKMAHFIAMESSRAEMEYVTFPLLWTQATRPHARITAENMMLDVSDGPTFWVLAEISRITTSFPRHPTIPNHKFEHV